MKASIGVLLAVAGLSCAGPIRRDDKSGPTDAEILNYALTLEHLEDTFYRQGLANYTEAQFAAAGYDATFYKNLKIVALDERTHVEFITTALQAAGAKATKECTYAFPSTDVTTFLATAAVLEGVGVSAYLGAAADIMSKKYLTAAGSILTVEARHSSYLRAAQKQTPFAQPFDAPLTFDEVYTLAAQFIVSCPADNPKLPVKAFPKLAVGGDPKAKIKSGDTITLSSPGKKFEVKGGGQLYAGFITVTGPIIVPATKAGDGYSVVVPEGVNGQSYVVLTSCKDKVDDDTTVAGPAIVEITNY